MAAGVGQRSFQKKKGKCYLVRRLYHHTRYITHFSLTTAMFLLCACILYPR